jgi:arginyl-tRNA synthetase
MPTLQSADPVAMLDAAFRRAIVAVLGEEFGDADPQVRINPKPELGDFQVNAAMSLAKRAGANPRELAVKLAAAAPGLDEFAQTPEVAGPGFINIRLKPDALGRALGAMDHADLGVPPDKDPHPIAIDLCGVNVAKQMHVGHLRATIIGDSLARMIERRGRTVFRENHLGDWGLTIAMTLHELRRTGGTPVPPRKHPAKHPGALTLDDLNRAYRAAQLACRDDERGMEMAIRYGAGPHRLIELGEQNASAAACLAAVKRLLVELQGGEARAVREWQGLIDVTMHAVHESLELLNVAPATINDRGESFYRDQLEGVVDAFVRSGKASEDAGAIVVRFPDRERPLLIRKSDGGFLYATTDLAAVRFRVQTLGAVRVIYVVDARQRDHFKDVFDAVRMIGWTTLPDGAVAELVHIPFGSVLGDDKKPLKTRSGENVALKSLLDEAIERGTAEVIRRTADPGAPTHGLPRAELEAIGRAVGIAAVKYADLGNDLVRDYVFNLDRMITFEGNTGPYLQYAHARIRSIFAKAGIEPREVAAAEFLIREPSEKALALGLLRYGGMVADAGRSLEPHRVCAYLYELANLYSGFYQQCPVIKAADEAVRRSRLRLCDLAGRVLADGLNLLGIEAPERM